MCVRQIDRYIDK
jgi:D-aminoacyl-tRNA deacylase